MFTLHESVREGDSTLRQQYVPKTLHFAMDLCNTFLNTQKCDSLQFFYQIGNGLKFGSLKIWVFLNQHVYFRTAQQQ